MLNVAIMPTCDLCEKPTKIYRLWKSRKICFECQIPLVEPKCGAMQQKKVGTTIIRHGDRFLWNSFKWFVIDFLDDDVVVRFEGTGDVATLPETLVAELVDDFNCSSMIWR